jgi:hypothetical protein
MAAVYELLKPYDTRLMRSYPVSIRINRVANDDEECSAPVDWHRLSLGSSCSWVRSVEYRVRRS